MKIQSITALAALLVAQTISAAPLLEMTTTPGFVMAEYALGKSCVIQDTGNMTINYNLRELSSKRASVLKLNIATIKAIIDKAALGVIKKSPNIIVDAGRIDHYAYQTQPDGSSKKIILWQEGDGVIRTNQSVEAKLLRNFIDLNCSGALRYDY